MQMGTGADEALDFTKPGYWIAGLPTRKGCSGFKQYYDRRVHGETSGAGLLRRFMSANGIEVGLCAKLAKIAESLEVGAQPELLGMILQVRKDPVSNEVQPKIYFRPERRPGLGVRRAVIRLVQVLSPLLGEEKAREVQRSLVARDQVEPLFYISVALRPDLEIETYHDCETAGVESFSAEHLKDAFCELGHPVGARVLEQVLECALTSGFPCLHFSVDLVGGAGATSLFFDIPTDADATHVRQFLIALGDLSECRPKVDATGPFTIEKSFTPAIVGVKLLGRPVSEFDLLIEEVSSAYRSSF